MTLDSDMDWDSFLDDDSPSSDPSSASLAEEEEDEECDYDERRHDHIKLKHPSPLVTRESRRQCRKRQLDVISQSDVFSPTNRNLGETRKRSHCSISDNYVWKSTTISRPGTKGGAAPKFLKSLRKQEDSLLKEWVPTVGRAGPLGCSIWPFVDHAYFRSIDAYFAAHLMGLDSAQLPQDLKQGLKQGLKTKSKGPLDNFINGVCDTYASVLPPLCRFQPNDPAFQNVPLGPCLEHHQRGNSGSRKSPPFKTKKQQHSVVRAHAICRILPPDLKNLNTAAAPASGGGGIAQHHQHRRTSSNNNMMEANNRFIVVVDDEVPPKPFHVHSDPKLGSTSVWQVNHDRTAVATGLSKKQEEFFALRPPILQILNWWVEPEVVVGGGNEESSNAYMRSGEKSIVSEIEVAQRELRQIMTRNLQVAKMLYEKVKEEEGRRALTGAEDETMAKWTRIMQIAAEEKVAEQQKQEEDMNAVCYVCGGGDSPHNDPIIFCDRCDLAVHRSCYFLPTVPSGDWYCWPCKDQVVVGNADAIGRSLPVHDKGPHDVSCVLCPVRGGAYLPTDCHLNTDKNADSLSDGNVVDIRSGGGSASAPRRSWAHAACAGWGGLVPDAWAGGIVRCKQWLRDANYRNLAEARRCTFCGGTKGAITKCSKNRCPTTYHVSCALKKHKDETGEGQKIHVVLKRDRRRWGSWSSLCSKHSNNDLALHNGISQDIKLLSSSSNASITQQKLLPPNRRNITVSLYGRTRSTPLGVNTTAAATAARSRVEPPPQRGPHPLLQLTNTPIGGERLCQICSQSDSRGLWQCYGTPQRPCNVVVHWRCYRGSVKSCPSDDDEEGSRHFYCDSCQEYEMVDAVEEVDKKPSHSCSSSTEETLQRKCILCPMRQGAFLRTSNGLWVHALCALCSVMARYVPPGPVDIHQLESSVTMEGCKVDAESSPNSTSVAAPQEEEHYCQLCGLKGRPYVDLARCCYCVVKCNVFMHATCAASAGCSFPTSPCASRLRSSKPQHGSASQIKRGSLLSVLCPKHNWDEDGLPSQLRSLCELSHKVDDFPSTAKDKKMGDHTSGAFLPFLDRWSRALVQLSWLSRTAVYEMEWRSAKDTVGPLQRLCLQQKAMASGTQLHHIILNGSGAARQMGMLGAELGVLLSTSVLGYFTVMYLSPPFHPFLSIETVMRTFLMLGILIE